MMLFPATPGLNGGGQPGHFTVMGSGARCGQESALAARRRISPGDV